MSNERKFVPFEIYKEIKNEKNLCQIIAVAKDSESLRKMVVYQQLFGNHDVLVCTIEKFMQNFSIDNDVKESNNYIEENIVEETDSIQENNKEEVVQSDLMLFLDAETYEEKRNLLVGMKPRMTERLIDDMAASLDVTVEGEDIWQKYNSLVKCVDMLSRYEINR